MHVAMATKGEEWRGGEEKERVSDEKQHKQRVNGLDRMQKQAGTWHTRT